MTPTVILFALLVPIGLGSAIFIANKWHQRDLREYLAPELKRCSMEYVSSTFPGWFHSDPFPEDEIEVGRPQTTVGGTWSKYSEYRIVTFKDSKGSIHQLWALVEFEAFQFRRVRWRAERKESLPAVVLNILEN